MDTMSPPNIVFPRRYSQDQRRTLNVIARAILLNDSMKENLYIPMIPGGLDPDPLSQALKDAHDLMLRHSLKACELMSIDLPRAKKHADIALVARLEFQAVHKQIEKRRLSPSGAYRGGISKYYFFEDEMVGGKLVSLRKVFHLRLGWFQKHKDKHSELQVLNENEIRELSGLDVSDQAWRSLAKFVQDGEKLLARLKPDQLVFREVIDAKTSVDTASLHTLLRERDYVQKNYPELEKALFALSVTAEYTPKVKLDEYKSALAVVQANGEQIQAEFSS